MKKKTKPGPEGHDLVTVMAFKVTPAHKKRIKKSARAHGMTMSEWVRETITARQEKEKRA